MLTSRAIWQNRLPWSRHVNGGHVAFVGSRLRCCTGVAPETGGKAVGTGGLRQNREICKDKYRSDAGGHEFWHGHLAWQWVLRRGYIDRVKKLSTGRVSGRDGVRRRVTTPLQPVIDAGCQYLVLGSIPGLASMVATEYYAHPRNLFWPFMDEIFGIDRALPYHVRLAQLMARSVGLWDVLSAASRVASSDATIRDGVANDFPQLLNAYQRIDHIILNGAAAARHWQRLVLPRLEGTLVPSRLQRVKVTQLPSTSPANAAMARAAKLSLWVQAFAA